MNQCHHSHGYRLKHYARCSKNTMYMHATMDLSNILIDNGRVYAAFYWMNAIGMYTYISTYYVIMILSSLAITCHCHCSAAHSLKQSVFSASLYHSSDLSKPFCIYYMICEWHTVALKRCPLSINTSLFRVISYCLPANIRKLKARCVDPAQPSLLELLLSPSLSFN